jgi:hypothetical protein
MSPKKNKGRKICPSDDELDNEISDLLAVEEINSIAKPMGVYAIFNRLKAAKNDWMLSPVRVTRRLEAMVKNGILFKVSEDDCRYFLNIKEKVSS